MDADAKLEMKRPVIYKNVQKMEKLSVHRRSKDAEFFKKKLLTDTLAGLTSFYGDFVNGQAISMSSTEEVRKIIHIIDEEEARALYYIHSETNREEYRKRLNMVLIEDQIETRLLKEDGFKRYLELYDAKKE